MLQEEEILPDMMYMMQDHQRLKVIQEDLLLLVSRNLLKITSQLEVRVSQIEVSIMALRKEIADRLLLVQAQDMIIEVNHLEVAVLEAKAILLEEEVPRKVLEAVIEEVSGVEVLEAAIEVAALEVVQEVATEAAIEFQAQKEAVVLSLLLAQDQEGVKEAQENKSLAV